MKKRGKLKNIALIVFLILAVFGIFFLYVAYQYYRKTPVPVPPGDHYIIRGICSPDFPDGLYYDFEIPQPAEVELVNDAHTGHTAISTPGGRGHSPVVNIPVGNWDPHKLKAISIEAWIKTDTAGCPADASLVVCITNAMNDELFKRSISISGRHLQSKQWFPVSTSFSTEGYTYDSEDRIRIYLWNEGENAVLMDDLTVILGSFQAPGKDDSVNWSSSNTNIPPYPPIFLKYADIGNQGKLSLNGSDLIRKEAKFFTGNFMHPRSATTEIMILYPGRIETYFYDGAKEVFTGTIYEIDAFTGKLFSHAVFMTGDLDGNGTEELLIIPERGDSTYIFRAKNDKGKILWNSVALKGKMEFATFLLVDLINDRQQELLAIKPDGNWSIFSFRAGQWELLKSSGQKKNCWDQQINAYTLSKMTAKQNGQPERVLCCDFHKVTKDPNYQLFRYDPQRNEFVNTLNDGGTSIFKGSDTLSPNDRYYPFATDPAMGPLLLRERSEWRYDVKLLSFTDSYNIIGNIDFECGSGITNPKYYEDLILLPGCFIKKNEWGIVTICRNVMSQKKEKNFPETVRLFIYSSPK